MNYQKYSRVLPFVAFSMMAMYLLNSWIFVRFVHYHSQHSILPVESYKAEIITAEDYAKLQDPTLDVVELSDGTKIMDRQPKWYEVVLPNYKKVGDSYVRVSTLGTAHYYHRWLGHALPMMMLTAGGLFITWWELRKRRGTIETQTPQ